MSKMICFDEHVAASLVCQSTLGALPSLQEMFAGALWCIMTLLGEESTPQSLQTAESFLGGLGVRFDEEEQEDADS
jgi:hypothetical protein